MPGGRDNRGKGLYLSLGPSLAAQAVGSPSVTWGGLVIFLLCGTGAAAALALRDLGTRTMMAAHQDLANPYTLWVAAYDLLGSGG